MIKHALGTVIGRNHVSSGKVLIGRNRQDAACVLVAKEHFVGVICDGCGSHLMSEFGAHFIAHRVAQLVGYQMQAGRHPSDTGFYLGLEWRLEEDLRELVRIQTPEQFRRAYIEENLLCTLIGVAVNPDTACIFGLGDGVYTDKQGQLQVLESPGNAPPYFAYRLTGSSLTKEQLSFRNYEVIERRGEISVLIGSDGVKNLAAAADKKIPGTEELVGPLSQFAAPAVFENKDYIDRRLRRINSEVHRIDPTTNRLVRMPGLLPDDTTLIVVHTTPEGGSDESAAGDSGAEVQAG